MRNPTVSKTKREAMLERQGRHCACCKVYLPTTRDARHDRTTNRMLCPACMILVNNVLSSTERGVTHEVIVAYFTLPPLLLPDTVGELTVAEKRAAGRQAVADGRVPGLTVEEYDVAFGTGPEQEPEEEGGNETP